MSKTKTIVNVITTHKHDALNKQNRERERWFYNLKKAIYEY